MVGYRLPLTCILWLPLAVACGDDGGGQFEPTYDNVAALLDRSCTFGSSCHGGTRDGQAMLNFEMHAADVTAAMLNADGTPRASCEYDRMPVVDPGNPDNSWLVVKIEAMPDASGNISFTPAGDWAPGTANPDCPLRDDADQVVFGRPMPFSATAPTPLASAEVAMVRAWVAMGAPGPE